MQSSINESVGECPQAPLRSGTRPLIVAARQGSEEIVQLLIDAGACRSPLCQASQHSCHCSGGREARRGGRRLPPLPSIILILATAPLRLPLQSLRTPFASFAVASTPHASRSRPALAFTLDPLPPTACTRPPAPSPQADLDLANSVGCTALIVASQGGHEVIVRKLIDASASPTLTMSDGCSALHMACHLGQLGTVQLLLDDGCDPHQPKDNGASPLFIAAEVRIAYRTRSMLV